MFKKSFDLQQSIKMKTQELEIAHYEEDLLRQEMKTSSNCTKTIFNRQQCQFENGIIDGQRLQTIRTI